jgi:hypothetical protein
MASEGRDDIVDKIGSSIRQQDYHTVPRICTLQVEKQQPEKKERHWPEGA